MTENVEAWQRFTYIFKGKEIIYNLFNQTGQDTRLQHYIIDESYCRCKDLLRREWDLDLEKKKFVISERSLLSNAYSFIQKLVEDGRIQPVDFALLREKSLWLYQILVTDFNLRPVYIFLHDTPTNLMKRVRQRDRQGEEELTEDYLDDLNQRYLRFYDTLTVPHKIIKLSEYEVNENPLNLDISRMAADIVDFVKNLDL